MKKVDLERQKFGAFTEIGRYKTCSGGMCGMRIGLRCQCGKEYRTMEQTLKTSGIKCNACNNVYEPKVEVTPVATKKWNKIEAIICSTIVIGSIMLFTGMVFNPTLFVIGLAIFFIGAMVIILENI